MGRAGRAARDRQDRSRGARRVPRPPVRRGRRGRLRVRELGPRGQMAPKIEGMLLAHRRRAHARAEEVRLNRAGPGLLRRPRRRMDPNQPARRQGRGQRQRVRVQVRAGRIRHAAQGEAAGARSGAAAAVRRHRRLGEEEPARRGEGRRPRLQRIPRPRHAPV